MGKRILVSAIVLGSLATVAGSVRANTTWTNDGTNSQTELDQTANAQTWAGLWGDVTGGVAGRPYVTSLSATVTKPDGTTQSATYVSNGTATTAPSSTPGDITMVIAAYNVCNKAKGETESSGRCYSSPNRLGASIAYVKGAGSVGQNFSAPTTNSGQPLSAGLLDLIKDPLNTTEFDVTINMNTWGQNLRWTWLNGRPTFWNVSNPGSADSVVRLKFVLTTGPSVVCDNRVPVEGCDPTEAAKNYGGRFAPVKALKTDMVLSLDNTGVDPVFTGTLFASSNADIGSLSAQPTGSPSLGFSYGISGMNEIEGQTNEAKFWAFVSDVSLVNYFGATADAVAAPEFPASEAMKVLRSDGGTSGAPTWTRWTPDVNGTAGYFLTVEGVRFDGKSVASSSIRAGALAATKPARFAVGSRSSSRIAVSKVAGGKNRLSVSASGSACKKVPCRWVVTQSTSKTKVAVKRLGIATTRKGTATASITVKAAKNQLLLVQLQKKVKGKWVYVTSRAVVAK